MIEDEKIKYTKEKNMKKFSMFLVILFLILPFGVLWASGGQDPQGPGTDGAAGEVSLAPNYYATLEDYQNETGKKIRRFNEAPMLAELVKSGDLPKVADRLPEEPLVVAPLQMIGTYGGSFTVGTLTPTGGVDSAHNRDQHLIKLGPDRATYMPNIAKGWEFSDDKKTITIYLRKGMKWSDGQPFTSADVDFFFNDIVLNKEISPNVPGVWRPGGAVAEFSVIDDYTVQFTFAIPRPIIVDQLMKGQGDDPFYPAHYLKKYHIKYNKDAGKIAKDEGYDSWWQCFNFHKMRGMTKQDLDHPSLEPWVLYEISSEGNKYYKRNPYYYKIDTAGNQLPYIDEQIQLVIPSKEVLELKAIAGEFDIAGGEAALQLKNVNLYMKSEEKGRYRILLWEDPSVLASYNFNMTHKDPMKREIFQKLKFRQAMSLAINREEISNVLYFGKAKPNQAIVEPECSFCEPWMVTYYTEYDPDKANMLLDEIGLLWDKNHEYRLFPNGETFALTLEFSPKGEFGEIGELVAEYWEDVGIKIALKELTQALWVERGFGNERDVGAWHVVGRSFLLFLPPWNLPPLGSAGIPWWDWYTSDGEKGEEPPADIRALYDIVDQWILTVPGSPEYDEIGKKMLRMNVENLYSIGTLGMVPSPVLVRDTLRNIPDEATWSPAFRHWDPYQADQWFYIE
jgi:peptide/nickel transport system substrate-binding protein